MTHPVPNWWQAIVLWPRLQYVLPTFTTWYFNRFYLAEELEVHALPPTAWAWQESRELLTRSEDRLRSFESKGPGLVTVSAIVAAGIGAAIVEAGDEATLGGRVMLGVALAYAVFSLAVPLYLVGPQRRDTIDLHHLVIAAGVPRPEEDVANLAREAAQRNTRRTQRIANLQEAARNEVVLALAVLLLWFVLGPVSGLFVRDAVREHAASPRSTVSEAPTSPPAIPTYPTPLTSAAPSVTPGTSATTLPPRRRGMSTPQPHRAPAGG